MGMMPSHFQMESSPRQSFQFLLHTVLPGTKYDNLKVLHSVETEKVEGEQQLVLRAHLAPEDQEVGVVKHPFASGEVLQDLEAIRYSLLYSHHTAAARCADETKNEHLFFLITNSCIRLKAANLW